MIRLIWPRPALHGLRKLADERERSDRRNDRWFPGLSRHRTAGLPTAHALRHTFISNLARAGIHPKTAQALARHSTITLTLDRYSHVGYSTWPAPSKRCHRSCPPAG